MTDLRKAAEMALGALERSMEAGLTGIKVDEAITALRQALAQPEQAPELVAVIGNWGRVEWVDGVYPQIGDRMYSAPPSNPWVSLTDKEIDYIWGVTPPDYENFFEFPRAIEAALRSKNT